MLPIIADGEAGFGGPLNVFELTKKFIKAGAAGVHFEDQLASEKKCGHMGGKVLVPTGTMIKNLKAARLAADIADGEAGFGGPLNVFELTKKFIRAGAAGVHFEDQLASEKKWGHMGGKVLVPT